MGAGRSLVDCLSLPIGTLAPATAALTYTVWVALRDHFDERTNVGTTFRKGLRRYGMAAFLLGLINLVALVVAAFLIPYALIQQPSPSIKGAWATCALLAGTRSPL
jgi:hypothetical protein